MILYKDLDNNMWYTQELDGIHDFDGINDIEKAAFHFDFGWYVTKFLNGDLDCNIINLTNKQISCLYKDIIKAQKIRTVLNSDNIDKLINIIYKYTAIGKTRRGELYYYKKIADHLYGNLENQNNEYNNAIDLFAEDLFLMLFFGKTLRTCEHCGKYFLSNYHSPRLCKDCRNNPEVTNPIKNNQRRNSVRYRHKQILDHYMILKKDNTSFREESNYYWAVVSGKKKIPVKKTGYRDDITNEEEYRKWLDGKFEEVKSSKKNIMINH
jgi:hypothetical protein